MHAHTDGSEQLRNIGSIGDDDDDDDDGDDDDAAAIRRMNEELVIS